MKGDTLRALKVLMALVLFPFALLVLGVGAFFEWLVEKVNT